MIQITKYQGIQQMTLLSIVPLYAFLDSCKNAHAQIIAAIE